MLTPGVAVGKEEVSGRATLLCLASIMKEPMPGDVPGPHPAWPGRHCSHLAAPWSPGGGPAWSPSRTAAAGPAAPHRRSPPPARTTGPRCCRPHSASATCWTSSRPGRSCPGRWWSAAGCEGGSLPRHTTRWGAQAPGLYAPTSKAEEAEVERFYEDLQDLLELTLPKKDVLFIIGDWNAKVGSQETPGVTGKFGLEIQNEAGQRLTEFCQDRTTSQKTHFSNNTREDSTCGHHQMVNIKIRLIIFFAAKDGEALYSQQKQDWELTMAQIMNSLLPNSDWNWRK